MTYQVHLEGLDTLRSAAWTQHEYVRAGQGFAVGSCGPEVFDTGLLLMFRSEYAGAYGLLSEAMASAVEAAERVHATLAGNLQTYLRDDEQSSTSLSALGLTIEEMAAHEHTSPTPQDPLSSPGLGDIHPYLGYPESWLKKGIDRIQELDSVESVSILQDPKTFPYPPTKIDTYLYEWLEYDYTEGVKLVDNVVDLTNHSALTGAGVDDIRDYENFIDLYSPTR